MKVVLLLFLVGGILFFLGSATKKRSSNNALLLPALASCVLGAIVLAYKSFSVLITILLIMVSVAVSIYFLRKSFQQNKGAL